VKVIEASQKMFPCEIPQYLVCDTAFHASIPPVAHTFAVPEEWREKYHVRRYGFHGLSHLYVSKAAAKFLGIPHESSNFITIHLGNGSSVACIIGGKSVDTSMGLTPLDGLVMGSRSGALDTSVVSYICSETKQTPEEVNRLLNFSSGLKGLCGHSDMREIEKLKSEGDEKATLAFNMLCYSIQKYVAQYYAVCRGNVDAVIFTGGIGENSSEVRGSVCKNLACFAMSIDYQKNTTGLQEKKVVEISVGTQTSSTFGVKHVLVVSTNEEQEIAEQICTLPGDI